ncbi:MAG: sensor histidine kinase [Lactovum sp.]
MRKKVQSLRARLLISNIGVVLTAFFLVILSFNLIIGFYIEKGAEKQLSSVVANQRASLTLPDLNAENSGEFNIRPQVILLTDDYEITTTTDAKKYEILDAKSIASELESKNISLENIKKKKIKIRDKTFYIETLSVSQEVYSLFYIDVTGIINFASLVRLLLFLIVLVVLLISSLSIFFFTGMISQPLSQLGIFAKRIGKGNFSLYQGKLKIKEFSQLADNLNDTARQLDKVDEDQKTFFQNASHELRTPLMSIKSYAEGIKYDVLPVKDSVEVILSETDKMTDLVEDLLMTSRLDKLKEQSELQVQDCRELMQELLEEQELLSRQRLELIADFDKKPVFLKMNYKSLRRAVSNLVTNASRYAKTKIIFTCKNKDAEVILSIKNDGEAIAKKDLPHLFERFYKGKNGVHGIGLSIVKSVVDQHGGEIEVKTDEKETEFIMIFKK